MTSKSINQSGNKVCVLLCLNIEMTSKTNHSGNIIRYVNIQGRIQDFWKGGSHVERRGGPLFLFNLFFFKIPWT